MNVESVKTLFSLFSGEENADEFIPLITLAVCETEKMLVSDEAAGDIRIEFLCAALANYRYVQIKASRDRTQETCGGRLVTSRKDSGTLKYAQRLLADYMSMCRELIKNDTFVFIGAGTEGDVL